MTTKISLVKDSHGDLEMHRGGCADLKNKYRHHRMSDFDETPYEGADLLAAIIAADEDMAAWFGEEAYTEGAEQNGCWATSLVKHAPCFAADVKAAGIHWDSQYSRPTIVASVQPQRRSKKAAPAAETPADPCRGKWSACGGKNPAKSATWHLCEACTARRAAAKK